MGPLTPAPGWSLRGVLLCLGAALTTLVAGSGDPPRTGEAEFRIAPGPTTMSEEEKAIATDPAVGSQHAVVLVDETEVDSALGTFSRTTHHLRAKILSSEGRDLANLEIPLYSEIGSVKEWWGRTLLPDGKVIEAAPADLQEQTVARWGRRRAVRAMKVALPGVVPGAVIDFGYVATEPGASYPGRVPLNKPWPVQLFRFRWRPGPVRLPFRYRHWRLIPACTTTRTEAQDVKIERLKQGFLVTGKGIVPIPSEPLMPIESEVGAAAFFYYTSSARDAKEYWDRLARDTADWANLFCCKPDSAVRRALEEMPFPEGADLDAKLRIAYDWLGTHVRNTRLRTFEESGQAEEESALRRIAGDVLRSGEGRPDEIDWIYWAVARVLGAEAHLVLAPDRREMEWTSALLSFEQLKETLVAVRDPAGPPGRIVFVDPGSGLPFGEVPWWVSGGRALLADPKGSREIEIPGSEAGQNTSETTVRIVPDLGAGTVHVAWSRSGSGQHGLEQKIALRRAEPLERKETVEKLCGGVGLDVLHADAPGLEDPVGGLGLECEAQIELMVPPEGATAWSLQFLGSWIEDVPDLVSQVRVHPVVLPFPRTDRATIEVKAPAGYVPKGALPAVEIENPFGRYALRVTAAADGYRVERSLVLPHRALPPDRYPGLRRFLDQVRRTDRTPLEFERPEGPGA